MWFLKINYLDQKDTRKLGGYFLNICLVLIAFILFAIKIELTKKSIVVPFVVSNRYFVCLYPMGVIATTFFSVYLARAFENKIIKYFVIAFLVAILALRVYRTLQLTGAL